MSEHSFFHKYGIPELVDKIACGKITISEIAEKSLEHISRLNSSFHAFVCCDPELLRRAAAEADQRIAGGGPVRLMEGMPLGVKDIFNTAVYPTQMGSPLWKDFRPGNDARAVYNCLRQGALIAGKTVTAEFAVHALNETINPYAVGRTPGTSSSGSAVAVATGMVPAALGTQTAGSIVRPASYCEVYGCKPSFGTIPRTGMLKMTDSLDSIGFFSARADGLRPIFDSLRVKGADYPLSSAALSDTKRQSPPCDRSWHIAFLKTNTWKAAESYAKESINHLIKTIASRPEFDILETSEPDEIKDAHETHSTIYNKSLSHYFRGEMKHSSSVSPLMLELVANGKKISPNQYLTALERQSIMAKAMDMFLSNYDAAICLATAGAAPFRNENEADDSSLIWTLTHLPVVCAPIFRNSKELPYGIQVIARRYNDYKLFNLIDSLVCHDILPSASFAALDAGTLN